MTFLDKFIVNSKTLAAACLISSLSSCGSDENPENDSDSLTSSASRVFCENDQSGGSCVPDVIEQFKRLALRPEALGFNLGTSPEPEQCKHYQGLARRNGVGIPYLFVSRSGNEPDGIAGAGCSDSDDPGNLLIVRMGSRDTNGERLRSNRLARNWDIDGSDKSHPTIPSLQWPTPPDSEDKVVKTIAFDGNNGWPAYGHPGGMQLIGDVLVIPLETPYDEALSENSILFVDVSDPETPVPLSHYNPGASSEFSAGLVGITPVQNADGGCCNYLMLITGKKNKEVRLYQSLPNADGDITDLTASDLDWQLIKVLTESSIESCLGGPDWHTGLGDGHQSLNFVRQEDLNGPLFLIGGRNTTLLPSGSDYLDLYRVHIDSQGNPDNCLLTLEESTHVTSKPIIGGGDSANFAAAGGIYVSPSGELIVYSTEYENDGPWTLESDGSPGRQTVRFAEWRHREMVRPSSPTLSVGITTDKLLVVDEGSDISLFALGRPPITKAWLQLFEDDDLGHTLPGLGDKDDWLAVDYVDWNKDNFDDFRKLHYSDDAGSWRWFAHNSCTIRANDDDFGDSNFPGRYSRTLLGTGQVEAESDLDSVANDDGDFSLDDELTSMQFFANCDSYYETSILVTWDLDGDGNYEASGNNPTFSAYALDGPTTITLSARAEHPTDITELGRSEPIPVRLQINNVAPTIQSFALVDSSEAEIGVDIPFALVGLDVVARASFTDPGLADTHTAAVNWGDGINDLSSDFSEFNSSTAGVMGFLSQNHSYSSKGIYNINIEVVDDDGGSVQSTTSVTVVSAAEALGTFLIEVDALIATETDPDAIKELRDARDSIDGNNSGKASNGALDKLNRDLFQAALVKLRHAMASLIQAEMESTTDFSGLKVLLRLTSESIELSILSA